MLIRFFISVLCLISILACKRQDEELSTNPADRLSFSEDTVFFDTIFTTKGSITRRLIVHNPNKNKVRVSQILLAGGSNSSYSVIINGRASDVVNDLEILGKDSIYILLSVLIDPSGQNLPFLISDSLIFDTNTNRQKVLLETYGQDAHFFTKETLACNTTWVNDKPYVLYDTLNVAAGCSLTVQAGCRIYGHHAAVLNIRGTLLVNGSVTEPVLMASDKTDKDFETTPGQWGGLYFHSSSLNNNIGWTTIRNAVTGIRLDDVVDADTIAELTLSHVSILHASQRIIDAGNVDINGCNVLLSNCPKALLKHADGCGVWQQCTFADYSNGFFREETALVLGTTGTGLTMYMQNGILWGDRTVETTTFGSPVIKVSSAIWRSTQYTSATNVLNVNPQFTNVTDTDVTLKSTSPAINLCSPIGIPDDIIGTPRDTQPDAGAYEFK